MKTRFIVVLLGMLIPSISFAGVPNADFMNFATNIVENIQTKLSGIQNALQVSTIQSTLSKMGSAKASISDFINKQKNAIMEYKEKMDNYISQAKVYMEKAKAFKEAAEKIKEEGLGEYLKNNAGDLAGKVGLDGDKIQNAVNTVDGAVQGVKEDGLGGYLKNNAGDIAGKVGLDGDKIQNAVNTVDGAVQGVKEDGLGGYLKNNAGDIAGKVGLDGDKIQNAVNTVDGAVQGVKEDGLGGYLKNNAGDIAGKVGLDGDKIQNAVNTVDGAVQGVKEDGLGGYLKNNAGDIADKVGLDGDKVQGAVGKIEDAATTLKKDGVKGIVNDAANAAGIDTDKVNAVVNKVQSGVAATSSAVGGAKSEVATSAKGKLVDVPTATPIRQALEGFSTPVSSVKADTTVGTTSKTDVQSAAKALPVAKAVTPTSGSKIKSSTQSVAKSSAPKSFSKQRSKRVGKNKSKGKIRSMGRTGNKKVASGAKGGSASVTKAASPIATGGGISVNSGGQLPPVTEGPAQDMIVDSEAEYLEDEDLSVLEEGELIGYEEGVEGADVNPEEEGVNPEEEGVNPEDEEAIADEDGVENTDEETDSEETSDKSEVDTDKVVKTEEKKDNKVDLDSVKKLNTSKGITPKRTQFKTSFGYGEMQNKYQLSFAILGGDSGTKTGTTPEGLLVVPDSISLNCNNLNYEDAIKDKKMDDCLRKMNDIASSEVTEEITKGKIDDASRDIYNGYVEYLTSAYFEAFEIYNDSLTFKNNEVDPIITTSTSDIDGSWRVAKEMHIVLGSRFNKLHRLWSRALGMKMYTKYANEKFTSDLK